MLDIHTHILPRVDDGSRSLRESEKMLLLAKAAGVTEIVATPHLKKAEPEYLQKVNMAFTLMRMRCRVFGIKLYLGYEIMYDRLGNKDVSQYCFKWDKPVKAMLIEFRPGEYPKDADMFLCSCLDRGITPIIAHPERYAFVQNDINVVSYLRGFGCLIQIDAQALCGPFYSKERRTASALIDAGLVDSISSDAHCARHYRRLPKLIQSVGSMWRPFDFDMYRVSPNHSQAMK